jgi:hypothetical protein
VFVPAIVYPGVENVSPFALMFAPSVTVPAVPANTAESPVVVFVDHACADEPFHQRELVVSHVPVPPSVLLPVEVQERLAACASGAAPPKKKPTEKMPHVSSGPPKANRRKQDLRNIERGKRSVKGRGSKETASANYV